MRVQLVRALTPLLHVRRWGTSNLFSHKRFMHGGPTNPDPEVVCMAAAQVKKCLDVTKELGGENFVMWGGRDGYQCLLNTDYAQEQANYATFCKAVANYADEIGFTGQLLLEPKPRDPAAHRTLISTTSHLSDSL